MAQALLAFAIQVGNDPRAGEEWLKPCHVVADILDQLAVAPGLRTVRRLKKPRRIRRAIGIRPRPVAQSVFRYRTVPAIAIVRRLDQRISVVTQPSLVLSELMLPWRLNRRPVSGRTEPRVNVVILKRLVYQAEIAIGAAAGQQREREDGSCCSFTPLPSRSADKRGPGVHDREVRLRRRRLGVVPAPPSKSSEG